jgi:putative ABC transport system permease protein
VKAGDTADITVSPILYDAPLNLDTATQIAKVPGVQALTPLSSTRIKMDDKILLATTVNPEHISDFLPLTVVEESLSRLAGGIAVSTSEAAPQGWKVGTKVSGELVSGSTVTLPTVAIFSGTGSALISITDVLPTTGGTGKDPGEDNRKPVHRQPSHPANSRQPHSPRPDEGRGSQGRDRGVRRFLNILYALLSVSVLIGALGRHVNCHQSACPWRSKGESSGVYGSACSRRALILTGSTRPAK